VSAAGIEPATHGLKGRCLKEFLDETKSQLGDPKG